MRDHQAHQVMWHQIFPEPQRQGTTLQSQLRVRLVDAVLDGRLAAGIRLPSSRELADMLAISRNTVVLVYEKLAEDGYLENRPRNGYYVSERYLHQQPPTPAMAQPNPGAASHAVNWQARMQSEPPGIKWLDKPEDWQRHRYPFLYGQFDPSLFPIADWRECSRQALDVSSIRGWAPDAIDHDNASLVEQLIKRVLPRRGIAARRDEVLLTVGAQQALYLVSELLVPPGSTVAVEDPGYMDARNIFLRRGAQLVGLEVDCDGVQPDATVLARAQTLYCTPSHQCPTGITLSTERRLALLEWARHHDGVIIEDDYDAEMQYAGKPSPALKAIDHERRVIYIGSLSKTLSPGLRIGYIVAPAEVVLRLRVLRRLMIRHPATNNQLAAALFISHGHYDRFLHQMREELARRAALLIAAVRTHLPMMDFTAPDGGSALWGRFAPEIDTRLLRQAAFEQGILIESGEAFCLHDPGHFNCLRLGFSSIQAERIEPGIAALAALLPRCRRRSSAA
ncbi:PLP-dependent aminotransferase family protein [uncultured Herbaspirillum sp.]|uniref:MocR-like pyridoxine biosynthesis transcription factor PdxR n=1 Tax=uncultured Herbaspirillum sp. TaxID=160236 RepID=UPI0025836D8A|nr:PLP-dependent aminotransferase family protein [uncultured Herbaspirillum sp.]